MGSLEPDGCGAHIPDIQTCAHWQGRLVTSSEDEKPLSSQQLSSPTISLSSSPGVVEPDGNVIAILGMSSRLPYDILGCDQVLVSLEGWDFTVILRVTG
jgi:hypothetical protein